MGVRYTTVSLVLGGALIAGLAMGCQEDLMAPANGTCPDFCPPEQLQVVDSILLDNVLSDSGYVGYIQPWEATGLQVYRDSTAGSEHASRAMFSFLALPDSLLLSSGDTAYGPIVATDSFSVTLKLRQRNLAATGLELAIYRIPVSVDSTTGYADLDPYFSDSTLLATVSIPDSLVDGNVIATMDPLAFPDYGPDGNRAAIGVALRNPNEYVQFGSIEANAAANLTRYVQLDSAGTSVPRQQGAGPGFDSFVGTPLPAVPATARPVGGSPAARTILRFDMPRRIIDSSRVLRATLVLLPVEPVLGPPTDSLAVIAQGLTADVGAKSPLRPVSQDSVPLLVAFLPAGSTDTVRLDVTDLVIGWTRDSTRPRALAVRSVPEGSSFAELRLGAASSGALRPRLHVTFVPPLQLGER